MGKLTRESEPRDVVHVEKRAFYVSLAAVALLLGCAVTSLALLLSSGRRDRRPTAEDEPERRREAPTMPSPTAPSPLPPLPVASASPSVVPASVAGRFVYAPESLFAARYESIRRFFDDGRIARTIHAVNVYRLPVDVMVRTSQQQPCAGGYDAVAHVVTLCVARVAAMREALDRALGDDSDPDDLGAAPGETKSERVERMTAEAVTYLALHGMGEAIASDLALPFAGRLTDVGDEFAALVLVQNGKALACVEALATLDESPALGGLAMTTDRFTRGVCLAAGGDPTIARSIDLLDTPGCVAEYKRVDDAWTKLLAPYETRSLVEHLR